jgi:excisionase family DNA binding protein
MASKLRSVATPPATASAQAAVPSTTPEPVLTIQDIADRLKLKPQTIYELTRRRNKRPLPSMRAGKVLRFYWREVERWLRGEVA